MESGIEKVDVYEFFKYEPEVPEWSSCVDFQHGKEKKQLTTPVEVNTDFQFWWKSHLPTADISFYFPFLMRKLFSQKNRVVFHFEEITSTLNDYIEHHQNDLFGGFFF